MARKKKFGWQMLYQVCRGKKNFGADNAREVAKVSGTEMIIWIDPKKYKERAKHQAAIEASGICTPRPPQGKKK